MMRGAKKEPYKIPIAVALGLWVSEVWIGVVWHYARLNGAKFAVMGPNEVGDFVAGIAAPLAFLWLVVAVFLQMSELAMQRRELHLMGEAMEQQAAETRKLVEKNAEAVNIAQTTLTESQRRAEEERIDRLIDLLVESVKEYNLTLAVDMDDFRDGADGHRRWQGDTTTSLFGGVGNEGESRSWTFIWAVRRLSSLVPRLDKATIKADQSVVREHVDAIDRIAKAADEIVNLSAGDSYPILRRRIELLQLPMFSAHMEHVRVWATRLDQSIAIISKSAFDQGNQDKNNQV